MKLSDPRPPFCSACFGSLAADRRSVDFEVAHDGPALVREEDGTPYVSGTGGLVSLDDLHVCEPCLKSACELLGLKPELHSRQLREIRRLEIENAHWKDLAKRLGATIDGELEQVMVEQPRRAPGRPRKVAA